MRLKYKFAVQKVGDKYMAVATGNDANSYRNIINLNETARFIFQSLIDGKDKETCIREMLDHYEVEESVARSAYDRAVDTFIKQGIVLD